MPIAIRPATPADLVFVVESWLDSYKDAHASGLSDMESFHGDNRPHCRRILAREGVVVLVAHHPKAQPFKADVMGWLAYERGFEIPDKKKVGGRHSKRNRRVSALPLIHYCYTKEPYRRGREDYGIGICTALLAKAGIDPRQPFYATCKTGMLSDLPPLPAMMFNPMIQKYPRRTDAQINQETSTRTKHRRTRRAKA